MRIQICNHDQVVLPQEECQEGHQEECQADRVQEGQEDREDQVVLLQVVCVQVDLLQEVCVQVVHHLVVQDRQTTPAICLEIHFRNEPSIVYSLYILS